MLIDTLGVLVKHNKEKSIGSIGELVKLRFKNYQKKRRRNYSNQHPNCSRLTDILGIKNTIGEFVFEPNDRMKTETIQKEEQNPIIAQPEIEKKQLPLEVVDNQIKPTPNYKPVFEQNQQNEELVIYSNQKSNRDNKNLLLKFASALLFIGLLFLIPKNNESIYIVNREQFDNSKISATEEQLNPIQYLGIKIPFIDSNSLLSTLKKEDKLIAKEKSTLRAKHVFSSIKIDKSKIYDDKNTLSDRPNLVFVGSFENKSNAEAILERIKNIGYENAEIIMKEDLPYAVVVTGFYQFKSSARAEVKALRKKGIEVYYSNVELSSIYRKK